MRMLLPLFLCATLAWAQADPFTTPLSRDLPPGHRTWTSTVGSTLDAKLLSRAGDKVKLEKPDGTVIEVSLAALSPADQIFVNENAKPEAKPAAKAPPLPRAVEAPPLPADFPVDATLDIIPVLKKKKTQGLSFSFTDSVGSRTVTSNQLKGKYVYLHTLSFTNVNGRQLQELKLLHEKYAARGFEIVSIHPYNYNNRAMEPRFTGRAVRENMRQAIEDYGITWPISFPAEEGKNPLLDKIADDTYINWLLDPDGKLVHTNISSGGPMTSTVGSAPRADILPLARALSIIFGD